MQAVSTIDLFFSISTMVFKQVYINESQNIPQYR